MRACSEFGLRHITVLHLRVAVLVLVVVVVGVAVVVVVVVLVWLRLDSLIRNKGNQHCRR